jgi:hypothetical protein
MQPDYASAFAAMARMKAGLGAGAAAPSIPIDRTYRLYEIWCYINFLLAAANRFPNVQPLLGPILKGCPRPSGLGTMLAQGEASDIALGPELRLTYQRRISTMVGKDGCHTMLIEAIPDIVISRVDPSGRCLGMVVLDPKYRVRGSLLDGVRDLHVYRDAILDSDRNRVIRGAIVLAPRAHGFAEVEGEFPSGLPGIAVARPGTEQLGVFARLLEAAVRALKVSSAN